MRKTRRQTGNVTPPATEAVRPVADGLRREPLTRERILRTALRIMDLEGLDAITMRRIGRELGVEAMSLYNHVEDKEDILEGISELVLSEFEFPEPVEDWEESVRRGARAWRSLLLAHPNVCTLLSERRKPIASPEALRPIEYALDVLHRAGLTEKETVQAFRLFGGYVMGSVTMQVGNMMTGVDGAPLMTPEELGAVLPPALVPRFLQMLPHLQECDPDEDFEFGLDVLIAGIRSRVRRRQRASAVG
jgi:AcrR family transcriptional regulator